MKFCLCSEVQKLSSLVLPSEVIIAQSSVPGKQNLYGIFYVSVKLSRDNITRCRGSVRSGPADWTSLCCRRRTRDFLQDLDQSRNRDGSIYRPPGLTGTRGPVQEQQPDVGGEARPGSVRFCPVWFGPARFGSVPSGSVRSGPLYTP